MLVSMRVRCRNYWTWFCLWIVSHHLLMNDSPRTWPWRVGCIDRSSRASVLKSYLRSRVLVLRWWDITWSARTSGTGLSNAIWFSSTKLKEGWCPNCAEDVVLSVCSSLVSVMKVRASQFVQFSQCSLKTSDRISTFADTNIHSHDACLAAQLQLGEVDRKQFEILLRWTKLSGLIRLLIMCNYSMCR